MKALLTKSFKHYFIRQHNLSFFIEKFRAFPEALFFQNIPDYPGKELCEFQHSISHNMMNELCSYAIRERIEGMQKKKGED